MISGDYTNIISIKTENNSFQRKKQYLQLSQINLKK